ncbi:TPA: hypothetical protein VYQ55_001209 [Streptococcus pneumoniae]|uniref:Sua5/YciO/YrdC/YwlC family protein n=1 Tax=Streptococcus pneumoniae TaxID=1313 RepID=UPI000991BFD6|nr:Sua5/YciO/YrdC/YwlC family protein [Streptococcus pneumoniae]HES9838835.1 hypothetical protein [Streptococcus pneumoniae]HEV1982888.1 hypothetical protein [Streptococcus pneumoniae]HEV2184690.1 hypothetical protein [Streptococcus pneumoniae]HEV3434144.1 hypothetical protein [Streptococcus pneumoniae]
MLKGEGGCIVCPTKVGYIIMTSDKAGLERKFAAKERKRNKPGVVLCGSMDELCALAQLNPEQGGARSTSPAPVVIRKGLDIDKIMMHLSDTFNSWDYRQVEYY